MKFFRSFLMFFLIAVIIGGVGYIGYSFFFTRGMEQSDGSSIAVQEQQNAGAVGDTGQSQVDMPGMQHGAGSQQNQQVSAIQQQYSQLAINQSNILLQNKDKLNSSITLIEEATEFITDDLSLPDAGSSGTMNGMNMQGDSAESQQVPAETSAEENGNKTTINIYPQADSIANNNSLTQSSMMPQNNVMENMSAGYDATKMEKLHKGFYKISAGKTLLDQLKLELASQAEHAAGTFQDPAQYYSNQYNLSLQNKTKLNQALTYLNEASDLIYINPTTGLVADNERMSLVHQSIIKLAEGVTTLNSLSDDLSKQTILLSNTTQNYIYVESYANSQQVDHSKMTTGLFGGLFNNISIGNVINIILILFVIGLVFGIAGFLFKLLKPAARKTPITEENRR